MVVVLGLVMVVAKVFVGLEAAVAAAVATKKFV